MLSTTPRNSWEALQCKSRHMQHDNRHIRTGVQNGDNRQPRGHVGLCDERRPGGGLLYLSSGVDQLGDDVSANAEFFAVWFDITGASPGPLLALSPDLQADIGCLTNNKRDDSSSLNLNILRPVQMDWYLADDSAFQQFNSNFIDFSIV